MPSIIERVISGGQTGADMGGLLAARDLGIPTGGWAPYGWITELGPNPTLATFGLKPCKSTGYAERTQRNIDDADGTIIFGDVTSPGSRFTERYCHEVRQACGHIPLDAIGPDAIPSVQQWIKLKDVRVLNVAGNRESKAPGIQQKVREFLVEVLR